MEASALLATLPHATLELAFLDSLKEAERLREQLKEIGQVYTDEANAVRNRLIAVKELLYAIKGAKDYQHHEFMRRISEAL